MRITILTLIMLGFSVFRLTSITAATGTFSTSSDLVFNREFTVSQNTLVEDILGKLSLDNFTQQIPVSWAPEKLINGSPVIFRYQSPIPLKSLNGTWLGKKIFFSFNQFTDTWYALAAIDYDTKPGNYDLGLSGATATGDPISLGVVIPIGKGNYRTTAISVEKKYVDPNPEDVPRILKERDLKNDLLNRISSSQLWAGNFVAPVDSSTSAEYGAQRTYNGKRQSVHFGLDYRATTGTPVSSINSGKVILAREMYFEGNCVIIDHGQGLLSLYFHLSEIKVREGEKLAKGQLIGLSGGTGRVTGPHLHLAVRWQGSYLNPATLLGIKFN